MLALYRGLLCCAEQAIFFVSLKRQIRVFRRGLALLSVLIKHDYLRSLFLTYFDDWWLSFSFFSFKRSFCYFFIWLSEPTLVPRPWSSGYERRLMTQRLCVRILVPVSRWIYFSQLLFVKLNCLKDRKNKKMQRMDHFYKKILIDVFVEY